MNKSEIEGLSLIVAKMLYKKSSDITCINAGHELLETFPVITDRVESTKPIILIDNITEYLLSALISLNDMDIGGSDTSSIKAVFDDMSDIVYDYFIGADVLNDAVFKLHSELEAANSKDYNRHEFLGIAIRLVNTEKWKAVILDYYPADSKEIRFLSPASIRSEHGNS
jgi:hypothetical protein